MSDDAVAVEVAGPETPDVTVEATPTEPQAEVNAPSTVSETETVAKPDEAPKRKSLGDIRKAARERARDRARSERAKQQPRTEDRTRFATAPESQPEEQVAEAAAPSEDEAAAADTVAEGYVRIEIPEDHPLRAQGRSHWDVREGDDERDLRAALNQWTRRAQLEESENAQKALQEQLEQEQIARLQLQARLDATSNIQPQADTGLQHFMEDLKTAYKDQPELIQTIEQALVAKQQAEVAKAQREAEETALLARSGAQLAQQVAATAPQNYPLWAQTGEIGPRVRQGLMEYASLVDARNAQLVSLGQRPQPANRAEFDRYLQNTYLQDPRIKDQMQKAQNERRARRDAEVREEARRELAAEQQRKAEEAQARHATRPPSPGMAVPGLQAARPDPTADRLEALKQAPAGGSRLKMIRESVRARTRGQQQ